MSYQLTKCEFCKKEKQFVLRIPVGKRTRKICIECHAISEQTDKRNHGTHQPKKGIFD